MCQGQNFAAMVMGWLLQDETDTVARAASLLATNSSTVSFAGQAIGGTFPASLMGLVDSGSRPCRPYQPFNYCLCFLSVGMIFIGTSGSLFAMWQVLWLRLVETGDEWCVYREMGMLSLQNLVPTTVCVHSLKVPITAHGKFARIAQWRGCTAMTLDFAGRLHTAQPVATIHGHKPAPDLSVQIAPQLQVQLGTPV